MRRLGLACALTAPAAGLVLGGQEPNFDAVGPIIARSCAPCHSPGGPAPFYLRNYEEAGRRAERIGISVSSMAMPPCQIDSDFGEFSSIPGLTTDEVVALRRWATSGASAGSGKLPEARPPQFSWRLGPPHHLVRSGPISAPAEGGVHWLFAKVAVPRAGRLRGLQIKPSDPRIMRQAVIGWAPRGISANPGRTTLAPSVRPIGAWAFGYYTWRLPKGSGIDVPEGAELHVMLQCQAVGRPGDASFELGLYYEPKPRASADWLVMEHAEFTIAVGEKPTYVVEHTLEKSVSVTALLPEFRYACERVRLNAELPGAEEKLLFGGRWDVYWTGAYNFVSPVPLPAGTKLRLSASYNNGFDAAHGTDVRVPIKRGTRLQDELCRMSIQYLTD